MKSNLRHPSRRIGELLAMLENGLVERRREVRLALLAALAGEHTLLIGLPGTAKSELARRLHLAFADARYFERLLTRFSVPEELFGPLSISALEQDRYERQTAGYLPQASIAFIDEVFKANSAILNALLTLLNERQFDNGAGRQDCPLISVIGATNEVPEDEVGEAFFDRFLMRLPVRPVSTAGFRELLALEGKHGPPAVAALSEAEREAITLAARQVILTDEVAGLLGELRLWLAAEHAYVSDRRWVKMVRLLKVAAASEGRPHLLLWDLWLLPWCVAPDAERQQAVNEWLLARLGVREALAPARLSRVVEAFEAQASLEQQADDLDYDASGRLRFSNDVDENVVDAKGAAQVARLKYTRRRRYGDSHIGARVCQVDELLQRISGYAAELSERREELAAYARHGLWLDGDFAQRADRNLAATAAALAGLTARAQKARGDFEALPRLPVDPGVIPEPVEHELMPG
ncbi:MAG: AAA family ATPase [Sterolibacterium sp.]|jgi:MoxR-like ATPase